MDETAPHAAVAVGERVDGLELRVADGRLRERGHVVLGPVFGWSVLELAGTAVALLLLLVVASTVRRVE